MIETRSDISRRNAKILREKGTVEVRLMQLLADGKTRSRAMIAHELSVVERTVITVSRRLLLRGWIVIVGTDPMGAQHLALADLKRAPQEIKKGGVRLTWRRRGEANKSKASVNYTDKIKFRLRELVRVATEIQQLMEGKDV